MGKTFESQVQPEFSRAPHGSITMGLLGSLGGLLLGVGASALVRGVALSSIVASAALAGAAGIAVALAPSLAPVLLLRRLSAPVVLADEL